MSSPLRMSPLTRKLAAVDYLVSALVTLVEISGFDADRRASPPRSRVQRELASPSGADTPEPPAITGSPADSRDAAIANLSLKLRDARLELSAALDAAAAPGSSGSEDATLEADLAEANERLCQYASDVSQARESLREATLENARLKNALEAFDDLVPGLRCVAAPDHPFPRRANLLGDTAVSFPVFPPLTPRRSRSVPLPGHPTSPRAGA